MATCPSCGEENPDRARFCLNCSAPLHPTASRHERKFATALFADIVGSTELAEREDPEVVQGLVSRAFDRLSAEIERYGGLIEKFVGDAVLAVFGVPSAHEDDPERAVRAGLEMQAVLSELNRSFAAEGRPELEMRIGVEAGEVLVDLVRAGGTRDRMLTGDAVNTAARLQSSAEPGHVVVGPAVYASTKEVIDYRDLEPLDLKGKAGPVPAWTALRVRARRRGERPPLGLEARLVGRDEELAVLKQTLQRVESEGRPALVTVLGNAGVGKSRLAWEFAKYVEGLPQILYWRRGRSLAYGNVSYSALAEAVKAQCEVLEDDPPELVAEKVDRTVEELFGDLEVAPHVRALVGGRTEERLSREELFDAWRRFLERMAARYPLVLALEDLHWADAGLLDFVDHLADWASGPILILTLARPELLETRPGWGGGKRNYAAIYLEPLSETECETMVEDLLSSDLPDAVTRLVAERSEGNPLYAEEIVRMLIDRGVLRATEAARWELAQPVEDVDVPRSIQALIAARLDTLPAEEKTLVQDAAVAGRIFWLGAVTALSERPATEARDAIGRLRVKEIVTPREPPVFSGELEFAFRHVLIRDVAYESLPKLLRASKHVAIARWAEERAGDRSRELAEVVGAHYLRAVEYRDELGEPADHGLEGAASRWARQAGDRAWELWQQAEAHRWFAEALRLGERSRADAEWLARVAESVGVTSEGLTPTDETVGAYRDALARYEALGRDRDVGRMQVAIAYALMTVARLEEAQSWVETGIATLESHGDSADLARALETLGNTRRRRGDVAGAEPALRRAVEMAGRTDALVVQGHAAISLGIVLLHLAGRTREGIELLEKGWEIAGRARDLDLLLRIHNGMPSALMDYAPDYERGWRILMDGIELSRRSGRRTHEAWMWSNVGNYAFDLGRINEIERAADSCREIGRTQANPYALGAGAVAGAQGAFLRGDLAAADAQLQEAMGVLPMGEEQQAVAYQSLTAGWIARANGNDEDELGWYLEGLELLGDELMGGMVDELLSEAARALVRRGRDAEAKPMLERLREVAPGRPNAEASQWWAEGVLERDAAKLRAAANRFAELTRPIDEGRVLLDLADAGVEPEANRAKARELFAACGAEVYLRQT
ncbi:MAG TPA: adenylate/guanylate cyclase domain-containing protein [Actinomycetota bacterium]|nr:adenylate/guanylate cyclase domain-containing protein [Actinomycetota bacterium]